MSSAQQPLLSNGDADEHQEVVEKNPRNVREASCVVESTVGPRRCHQCIDKVDVIKLFCVTRFAEEG